MVARSRYSNSIDKIQYWTANLTYDRLCEDDKTLDAVVHNLLIIGEEIAKSLAQLGWQFS